MPDLHQGADDAARHTAGNRSGSGRCKPSGGNDGTNTWNCQQAKPGQGTKRAQGHGANARSGGGTFGAIIAAVAVLVMLGINSGCRRRGTSHRHCWPTR